MPIHEEKRLLPYTPKQMFDLVAAVEDYPKFLPWCIESHIHQRNDEMITADLVIGFKVFSESFTSEVALDHPRLIEVKYTKGPMRYLNNRWEFIPADNDQCLIDFYVDFEFRSLLLQRMIGVVFKDAVHRMVDSFENRAQEIYA
tara:strand:- start:882 stop:1313 length:432 start_codon:yes stop_codon:yes gene_type:complete